MPRGRPKKKPEEAPKPEAQTPDRGDGEAAAPGPGEGRGINKMACVRQALAELGNEAKPKDIQDFLRREFQLAMDTKMISTYKGSLLKKAGGEGRSVRPPTGRVVVLDALLDSRGGGTRSSNS